jgi:uncharacterized protein
MNRNQVLPQIELSNDPSALCKVDFCTSQPLIGAGYLPISSLPRVAQEVSKIDKEDGFHWKVATHLVNSPGSEPHQMLDLGLKGRIHVVCQRCLQDYGLDLNLERQFVLVATEAQADAYPIEDDELEPLVASQHFDLLALFEDEILLSLPLIPKHPEGACEINAALFGEAGATIDGLEKPENPFNILKNMKKN